MHIVNTREREGGSPSPRRGPIGVRLVSPSAVVRRLGGPERLLQEKKVAYLATDCRERTDARSLPL